MQCSETLQNDLLSLFFLGVVMCLRKTIEWLKSGIQTGSRSRCHDTTKRYNENIFPKAEWGNTMVTRDLQKSKQF